MPELSPENRLILETWFWIAADRADQPAIAAKIATVVAELGEGGGLTPGSRALLDQVRAGVEAVPIAAIDAALGIALADLERRRLAVAAERPLTKLSDAERERRAAVWQRRADTGDRE